MYWNLKPPHSPSQSIATWDRPQGPKPWQYVANMWTTFRICKIILPFHNSINQNIGVTYFLDYSTGSADLKSLSLKAIIQPITENGCSGPEFFGDVQAHLTNWYLKKLSWANLVMGFMTFVRLNVRLIGLTLTGCSFD